MDFYNRGGDFAVQNIENFDVDIQPLGLTDQKKADLVAFLKALTDRRVTCESAPFDRASINVPNGGVTATAVAFPFGTGASILPEERIEIGAVRAGGNGSCSTMGFGGLGTAGTPLRNFLQP